MRSINSFAVVFALCTPAAGADVSDPAPLGSVFVGTWARFSSDAEAGEKLTSTDARFTFTERKGNTFKAKLEFTSGQKALEITGTVTPTGADNLKGTVTKVINGEFANDIVGRAVMEGFVRNGTLKAKHRIPGGVRFGEFDLKLQPVK
jgi:hypothetical protein